MIRDDKLKFDVIGILENSLIGYIDILLNYAARKWRMLYGKSHTVSLKWWGRDDPWLTYVVVVRYGLVSV